jgi:hypothetical protein
MLRKAAARRQQYLDAHLAGLMPEEARHFREAARIIFSLDDETKRLTKGKRAALKRRPIETAEQETNIVAEICKSLMRVLDISPPASSNLDPIETAGYVSRILMANLISKGLLGAEDRATFIAATAAVAKLGAEAKRTDSQKSGRSSPRKPSKHEKSAADVARLRLAAQTLLKTTGHRPQMERARILNARLGQMWPSPRALIECARRNDFSV